jgi:hypothetical protein
MYPHLQHGNGEFGETGRDTARQLIESGKARPADTSMFRDQARPAPAGREGPAFDVARVPVSFDADPQMLQSFGSAAREMGLSQSQGQRLLQMHADAARAGEEAYSRRLDAGADALARSLPAEGIEAAKAMLHDDRYTPAELRPWLLRWSHHPQLAQLLVNWAMAARGGRY